MLSAPADFFEGMTLELRCRLAAGNHVLYKWLVNGQLVSQSDSNIYSISGSVESCDIMITCSQQSPNCGIFGFDFSVKASSNAESCTL